MRSTLLLAALAAGAVDAFEKRVYVTDWTTVTVTKTVTAPAVTFTVPPVQQNQQPLSTSSSIEASPTTTAVPQVSQAAPQVSQPPTVAIADNSDNSDSSALAKKSPAPEAVPQEGATTWEWSTTWASTWGGEQPAATLATSSSTASEPAATPSTHYETTVLYNHNIHRSNHSAPSLGWNKQLEESARVLASRCVYDHDTSIGGGSYGQNIGYGKSANEVGEMLTNMMYNNEINYFPWSSYKTKVKMDKFHLWGHFSQMIWKSTTSVGCATVVCDSLDKAPGSNVPFTVCNYSPAGNMDGEYPHNIAPGGSAAVYNV